MHANVRVFGDFSVGVNGGLRSSVSTIFPPTQISSKQMAGPAIDLREEASGVVRFNLAKIHHAGWSAARSSAEAMGASIRSALSQTVLD
jgi:hypothetical protein